MPLIYSLRFVEICIGLGDVLTSYPPLKVCNFEEEGEILQCMFSLNAVSYNIHGIQWLHRLVQWNVLAAGQRAPPDLEPTFKEV